ncbi:MAG: hypothetical protein Q9219_001236 [cf. Caloplaca sp. 3 TL-2023]
MGTLIDGDFLAVKLGTDQPRRWKGDAGQELSYEALSYVWAGDDVDMAQEQERFVPLLLPNYQVLPVTEALRKALMPKPPTRGGRTSSYHASNIWGRNFSCMLFRSVVRTFTESNDLRRGVGALDADMAGKNQDPKDKSRREIYELVKRDLDPLAAQEVLEDYMKRTWFGRAWTYQEAVVCKHTIMQLGPQTATIKAFREVLAIAYSLVVETNMWYSDAGYQRRVHDAVNTLLVILDRRENVQKHQNTETTLRLVLSQIRPRKATDDRDKVYAALGLMNLLAPARWSVGLAQYQHPVDSIYKDCAVDCIDKDQNLDILSRCCIENSAYQKYDLPSWVEDWSIAQQSCPHPYFRSRMRSSGSSLGLYSAAAHLKPQRGCYDKKNGVMSLNGLRLGIIEVVADRIPRDIFDHDELIGDGVPAGEVGGLGLPAIPKGGHLSDHFPASLLKHAIQLSVDTGWGKLAQNVHVLSLDILAEWVDLALETSGPDPYGGRRARLIAFWRTLVEDLDVKSEESEAKISRLPSSFDSLVEDWIVDDNQVPRHKHFSEAALNFEDQINTGLLTRRMFRTQNGYVGISCSHVQAGDEICLLWGGTLPFLLREVGKINLRDSFNPMYNKQVAQYALVGGEVYVHGMTDGNAIDVAKAHGAVEEEFFLV